MRLLHHLERENERKYFFLLRKSLEKDGIILHNYFYNIIFMSIKDLVFFSLYYYFCLCTNFTTYTMYCSRTKILFTQDKIHVDVSDVPVPNFNHRR